ncbi:MAG: nucleotidyltransferase family protein [Hydrogenibacillus sp.]|nr:nucleotidyltransferase family protein [Hydrogenibacillus sp.]
MNGTLIRIGGVILAAGLSSRMGRPKQWLPLGGKPLFRHSVEAAVHAGLDPVILVAGGDAERMIRAVADLPVEVIDNPDFRQGMSTSLKRGIRAVQGRADACLILLADQPFVSRSLIDALRDAYQAHRAHGTKIVRPVFQGIPGHPVLVDASLFPYYETLEGDVGGKAILERFREAMVLLPWDDRRAGVDVDTPEDYRSVRRWLVPEEDHPLGDDPKTGNERGGV